MRWGNGDGWREEFKYWITPAAAERVKSFVSPFVTADPYVGQSPSSSYVVRSIYYDTPGFDFYYHKLEGLKVRKKLRVRGYNYTQPDARVFFEIKHKMGRKVFKERALLPLEYSKTRLNETFAGWKTPNGSNRDGEMAENRFLWLKHRLGLMPVILVVYDRIAFVGRFDPTVRLTMDMRVRSMLFPTMERLYDDQGLRLCTEERIILELKFNGTMPSWMVSLVRSEGLAPTSISKYGLCLESWMDQTSQPEQLHSMPLAV